MSISYAPTVHLQLDDALPDGILDLPVLDARAHGPRLRYLATRTAMRDFWREHRDRLDGFTLYGSGDFHHLSGLLAVRAATGADAGPVTIVSFDNHPDWDRRPPYFACGGWASRVLDNASVAAVHVWGCGHNELHVPHVVFGDRRVDVNGWAERHPPEVRARFHCPSRDAWRDRFAAFARTLRSPLYVTVDLDCLRAEDAATNWENGLFTPEDVAWAIGSLRDHASLAGGDVCGAWSTPRYARPLQRLAGAWDHPRDAHRADARTTESVATIWAALTE